MSDLLKTEIKWLNEGVKFKSTIEGKPEVITDYIPPYGDGKSILPLELFLISLGTCAGGVILPLLKRTGKSIKDFRMNITGKRRDEHPKSFEEIKLAMIIVSKEINNEEISQAIKIAEAKLCPVWAMIKGNVKIDYEFNIEDN